MSSQHSCSKGNSSTDISIIECSKDPTGGSGEGLFAFAGEIGSSTAYSEKMSLMVA